MNPLAQELVKEILGEDTLPKKRIVGMFAGGFKPPTLGHLEVVKLALKENPEMDELIIIVGSGTRDTITQADSLAIWSIYKKYLPSKVKVITSPDNKPPIGAIYSYARKNPDETIYYFIGTREGNEGDLKDVAIRTKSLRKLVYQNVKFKEIITSDGVSGTKARQAILDNDKETFLQFIPNIPEVDEIWNMLTNVTRNNIEEDFDQQDVEDLDSLADRELNPIDVVLTSKHFFDRLNDPRNTPEIDYLELEDFFTKLGDNRKEFIDFLNQYKSVVATDSKTNINIPFMKIADKAIAKTIMRKRNFQTPDVKVELHEKDPKKGTGKKPKGSGRRLYTDENPKDTVKIKFSTRQDIVDTLSKKSFKSKSHARQSQVINLIHQRVRAAYGRAKKPEVKKRLKSALDYITKRKEASKAKTQRLKKQKKKANENVAPNHNQKAAPFGSGYKQLKEELTPQIISLTQYMDDNGLNLKPYPKIKFIDNDIENAEKLLGRTAYYDPNQKLVALYTMDRHPKDILRSYAHELIHHHQNLSNTLNHSNTTNTNDDDNLEQIEREAYENGNILFRKWEDEKKNILQNN